MSGKARANMDDIMKNHPQMNDTESETVTKEVGSTDDVNAAIRKATGLDMSKAVATAKKTPAKKSGVMTMLTPEEAAQFATGPAEKIDTEEAIDRARNKHADQMISEHRENPLDLMKDAINQEEERDERHAATLADPDAREKIFEGADPDKKVKYEVPMSGSEKTERVSVPSDADNADIDSLVPSYSYEDDATPPEADSSNDATERPNTQTGNDDDYAAYLKTLDTVNCKEPDGSSIITTAKEKATITEVPTSRSQTKILGDQAFLNSITKFKKDTFRTVTVPLVNSGFSIDMVGTGAVDLTLLYSAVDQNTMAVDYELEKMRTVMRNVVGTHPNVDRNNLRNMIHFADYQLMAYAHIAATLKDVELIHTCTECGKDFHVVCNSSDLILNMDELKERMQQIKQADTIQEYSLLANDQQMTTTDGFVINMGHPSYAEYIQYLTELKNLVTQLPKAESDRIQQMATILPYIRSIVMPNRVHTNNLYQRYLALGLLSDANYTEMANIITNMSKKVMIPKFGVKRVTCPHCKKVNTDITYDNLNDLLFFHITVTRLLNKTEE